MPPTVVKHILGQVRPPVHARARFAAVVCAHACALPSRTQANADAYPGLRPPLTPKPPHAQAALQLALLAAVLGPLGDQLAGGDGEVQRTLLFNTFVWLQLFNQVRAGWLGWGVGERGG